MVVKHLDAKIIDIVDQLPEEALKELLAYIVEKHAVGVEQFLNELNLVRILSEDREVLSKLAQ